MPSLRSERELNRDTLIRALKGNALAKLDALHGKLKSERAAATSAAATEREKVNAERAHAEYLQAFQGAKTLERIRDSETRYGDNDPDGLIARLLPAKAALEQQAYRDAYAGAATSAQLQAFIDAYSARDPDRLVPDARKRLATAKKQEQLAAQAAEKKGREDAANQEAAARQAALKKDADRLKYIRSLQSRFGDRITAEHPEGYSIVSRYRSDCRAGDGRVLPLLNALYASIVSLEENGVQMRFHIQNRGQQVRITSEIPKNGKPMGPRQLYYEINEWGDLRAIAIRSEAVLNPCHGFQGSIWLMHGEPGYQSVIDAPGTRHTGWWPPWLPAAAAATALTRT